MKILVVCQYFSPEPFRVQEFCQGLQNLGYEVTVLTGMPNYPTGKIFDGYGLGGPYRENMSGIDVYRVPIISRGKTTIQLAFNYLSFAFFGSLRAVGWVLQPFDLVFVYQLSPITMAIPGCFLAKMRRIPVVIYTLDIWPDSIAATGVRMPSLLYQVVDWLSRKIYLSAKAVFISSRGFANRLKAMGVGFCRIHYWPQSIEKNQSPNITVVDEENKRNLFPKGFVVLFAGNMGIAQSMETLVEAANRLKEVRDIHWVILGDGRMREWVVREVDRLGLAEQVHWLGRFPAQEMPFWFSMADALLVSLKRNPLLEITLPAKVQSYLYSGRPILAAMDGEGAAMVKAAKAGLACPAEDVSGLVRNVKMLYAMSPEQRADLGRNGKRYATENFDNKKLMQALDEIISDTVAKEK